jgi:glycine cleavage system aminomethyltransferase T
VTARGHVNKRIVGLRCAAPVAPGDRVSSPDRPDAGMVTSAAHSPSLGCSIALAYLHRLLWAPGTKVAVGAEGHVEATVVELPFVTW